MEKDFAICYMVAGMSSRFGGRIKQFAKVGPDGESLIEYSLNQAIKVGFNKIVFIVGEKTEKPFREMFGDEYKGVSVFYTKQVFDSKVRDKPWGTTDALCSIKDIIDCPFVVCNGDDIYGVNSFRVLYDSLNDGDGECVTLGYELGGTLPDFGSVNRGVYNLDADSYVKNIDETIGIEKNGLDEIGLNEKMKVSMNIFALYPDIVFKLNEALTLFKENNKGNRTIECYLPVELSNLIDKGEVRMKCCSTNDKWFGVTNPEDEEVVREKLKRIE